MRESKSNNLPVILKYPSFGMVWSGQLLSQSSIRMFQIAILWWILSLHSQGGGMMLGLFMVGSALPAILLVKFTGRIIDKSITKKILLRADIIATVLLTIVASFVFFKILNLYIAFVVGVLIAIIHAFYDPSINKAVNELVDHKDLDKAVSFQAATQSIANFTGAVLGAFLIDKLGLLGVAVINSFAYAISAGCIYLAKFDCKNIVNESEDTPAKENNVSGWAVLAPFPFIKYILIGFGLINFFATPTLVILPVYTMKLLEANASVLALLEAALWIGLIFGTFLAPKVKFFDSLSNFGFVCLFVFGFFLASPGLYVNFYFYCGCLFIAGLCLGINNVHFITYFQQNLPQKIKGRFFAMMQAIISFSFPIAYFVFGSLTDLISVSYVVLIQGVGIMLISFYFLSLKSLESKEQLVLEYQENHA